MALDTGELSTMDATAQAELVQRKELTPLELVDAAIARIERVNPTLNAVIIPLYEDARAAAVSPDLPEGPFRGVPFLLKDIGAMQKGQPTRFLDILKLSAGQGRFDLSSNCLDSANQNLAASAP